MNTMDLFLITIPYALKGWLAIFAVTLVIVGCISLLNKFGTPKSAAKEEPAE